VAFRWTWFDRFCLLYPPGWLILFNRHWQHYHPGPAHWIWPEYLLFLVPGGFYLALALRGLRGVVCRSWQRGKPSGAATVQACPKTAFSPLDDAYQQAFRREILAPIVQGYFRASLHLPSPLPSDRPLIVVMNHAGMCFPWDFIGLGFLLGDASPNSAPNAVRPFAHPIFFDHVWLRWWLPAGWAQTLGGVRAERERLDEAIAQPTVLLYAPEGWRGLAKGWPQRNQLAPFDPSVIRLSVRHRIPILPIVCIGNEGLHPWAINLGGMARRLGLPMFPLSPLIPLFLMFPSLGVWAMRSPLQYHAQPLWHPWENLTNPAAPTLRQMHGLAEQLRVRLQQAIKAVLSSGQRSTVSGQR
jgi:1-acyl-sn-glycerol-3-phosphate acyltransferase